MIKIALLRIFYFFFSSVMDLFIGLIIFICVDRVQAADEKYIEMM